MTRRIALQLIAVIAGAWQQQQAKPDGPLLFGTTLKPADLNAPISLHIHMNWKDITVVRGDRSVTVSQDELFEALVSEPPR